MPAIPNETEAQVIPGFPDFREPQLSDASILHEAAFRLHITASELTFTNIYVWRHASGYKFSNLNGNICVLAQPEGHTPYFLPRRGNNELDDTVTKMFAYLRDKDEKPLLSRVPEDSVRAIVSAVQGVVVEEDLNNADYIYLVSDLAELPGRKFHKKRNHIARFTETHSFEYRRITPDLLDGVRDFQIEWCKVRGCFSPHNPGLAAEHNAIMEILDNFEALKVIGGVIIVEDKVAAFTIGEPLNNDTFVIHFEKANPDCQGCYQAINQLFCKDICNSYKYVNREQDLGEPGLRQAKRSYYQGKRILAT